MTVSRDISPRNYDSRKTAPPNRIAAGLQRRGGIQQRLAAVGQNRIRHRVSVAGAVLPIARSCGGRRATDREPGALGTG